MENMTMHVNQTVDTGDAATTDDDQASVRMLFGLIGLFIFLENFAVFCLLIAKREFRTTVHSVLVLSLSSSDFLLGLSCMVWSSPVFVGFKTTRLICEIPCVLAFTSVGSSQSQSFFICLDSFLCTYNNARLRKMFQGKRLFATLLLSYFINTLIVTFTVFLLYSPEDTTVCREDIMFGDNIRVYHLIYSIITVPVFITTVILYLVTVKRVRNRLRETDAQKATHASRFIKRIRSEEDNQQHSPSVESGKRECSTVKDHRRSSNPETQCRIQNSDENEIKMRSNESLGPIDSQGHTLNRENERENLSVSNNLATTSSNKIFIEAERKVNINIHKDVKFYVRQNCEKGRRGSELIQGIPDVAVNQKQPTFRSKMLKASTITITVIVVTKLILVGPFVITRPFEVFLDLRNVGNILFVSLMLNSVANPIIYLWRIKAFRKTLLFCSK